jgi:hypothetical protein
MQTVMQPSCSLSNVRGRRPFQKAQQPRLSCTALRPAAASAPHCSARQSCVQHLNNRACGIASLSRGSTSRRASRQLTAAVCAEISYVMIKPDGVQRGLVGEVRAEL